MQSNLPITSLIFVPIVKKNLLIFMIFDTQKKSIPSPKIDWVGDLILHDQISPTSPSEKFCVAVTASRGRHSHG